MKIARIGHASLLVESGEVFAAIDPVLVTPFDCDTATFDPPVELDPEGIRERTNLIILSHDHADHFDVRSLARFDRDTLVYYPAGATLIEHALERLGFAHRRALVPGRDDVTLPGLRIVPTPSDVDFPEMGILLVGATGSCWNPVDSVITDETIALVRRLVGRPDLMLANYQPFLQLELCMDGLGAPFPFERYGRLLRCVLDVRPRCVVPSACGVEYTESPWLNARGFPMTPRRFIEDLARVDPEIRGELLGPGRVLTVGQHEGAPAESLSLVRATASHAAPQYQWRPDRGVEPLRDSNPRGLEPQAVRQGIRSMLGDDFCERLAAPEHACWVERMERLGVQWTLEVVYPDRTEQHHFDFVERRWASEAPPFPDLLTAITGSALYGLKTAHTHPDRLMLGAMRVVNRMYAVHRDGVQSAGSLGDEPLSRLFGGGSRKRYTDRELTELGC